MSKSEEFLNYIKESRSKGTYKSYKQGLKNFEKWLSERNKTVDDILEMHRQNVNSGDPRKIRRMSQIIEMFHKWLMEHEKLGLNTARTYANGVLQLFRYYSLPIALEPQSRVSKTTITTKDFVPTIEQYRRMFNVADIRGRLIISMGLDLGWRIGDVIKLQKNSIPDLNQKTPIPFELITEKEDILAKSFLSAETVELLKTYIPTLKTTNPYLFASNGKKHLKSDAINQLLKQLAKKSNVKVPQNKRLRFHSFRKRFLSTCANLKIDINTAKILVGKSVEKSMLTYLSEVEHKKAFIEVREYLSLSNGTVKSTMQTKDAEIIRLQKELEKQRLIVKGMLEVFGEEILKKALAKIEDEKDQLKAKMILTRGSATENIQPYDLETVAKVLEIVGKQREKRQLEEYRKIIENNNNNNH